MTTETKAEMLVPSVMPNLSQSGESAIGVTGVLAAIVYAIFHFRRKASRDGTEMIKDRAEGQLIQDMMKERESGLKDRDAARESERFAWTKANEMAVENARLKSENEFAQREIARLTQMVGELQQTIDEIKTRLQHLAKGATGHTGFEPPI